MTLNFQDAYDEWIRFHIENGEERRAARFKNGLQHAEKLFVQNVWWPAFRHFDGLYPEYEVRDYKEGTRYIDFAYLHGHLRIAIEVDGLRSHWRDITQEQFCDHARRQNHLVIDRWNVIRFGYMDVEEYPRICQQTLQQLIGSLTSDTVSGALQAMKATDRGIVRMAFSMTRPVTVKDVVTNFHIRHHAAAQHLKRLTEENWLEPASGSQRIRSYRIHKSRANMML